MIVVFLLDVIDIFDIVIDFYWLIFTMYVNDLKCIEPLCYVHSIF